MCFRVKSSNLGSIVYPSMHTGAWSQGDGAGVGEPSEVGPGGQFISSLGQWPRKDLMPILPSELSGARLPASGPLCVQAAPLPASHSSLMPPAHWDPGAVLFGSSNHCNHQPNNPSSFTL